MSIDADAKRYFPVIVCAMLGVAAYFQASAIGSLISASIGDAPEPPVGTTAAAALPPVEDADAAPILERNPFDSTAAPIDPKALEEPANEPGTDERGIAACNSGRVVLIAQNDDPAWAFAAIADGTGGTQLRRVGDKFGAFELESLAWDRVYLKEGGRRCFLAMGPTSLSSSDVEPSSESGDPAGAIKKISDTEYSLDRATLDAVLGAESQLLSGVRMTPVRSGDRVTALKLGVVRQDSRVHELGLRTRDELQTMNGITLSSPEQLFQAYESTKAASRVQLRVQRAGAPVTITYQIQ